MLAGTAPIFGTPGGLGGHARPGDFIGGGSAATRKRMLTLGGGDGDSEAAVAADLLWLVHHQAPDGHWSLNHLDRVGHCNCRDPGGLDNDVAATAFGLLPLLGAGYTP